MRLKKSSRRIGIQYTVVLLPDEDGGGFTVTVPALPGCFTQGHSIEEALENAREAIACHVEGLVKAGETIPADAIATAQVRIAA